GWSGCRTPPPGDASRPARAYQGGGFAEIEAMRGRGEITALQRTAWQRIDDGVRTGVASLVWEGTLLLAKVEQDVTLQQVLSRDSQLWVQATAWKKVTSPVPGDDSTFQQYRLDDPFVPDNVSFGDGMSYGD